MVLTIAYPAGHSSDDWGIVISDGENAGSPDDNAIFLFANKLVRNKKTLDKADYFSNRKAHRWARGKIQVKIQLPNVFIPTRSMTEMNLIAAKVDTWMAKNHAPIYMWVRTKVAGSWVYMKHPSITGSQVNYLMGYLDDWTDEISDSFICKVIFSNAYTGGT